MLSEQLVTIQEVRGCGNFNLIVILLLVLFY